MRAADDPEALTVGDLMTPEPVHVGPATPIQEAIRLMNRHRIGGILVLSGEQLLGIFTERDLLKLAAEMPIGWRQLPVGDYMTRDPHCVNPDAGWEDAMALMDRLHVRHLPVIEHGRLVGIVSSRNLMSRRAEHLNRLVERRTHELSERDRQIQYQLTVAGRLLNRAMLPKNPPGGPELRWAIRYSPLDQLGGDYYDFVAPDDRHLGVLIADAAGHSVAAAMVAVMARIAFAEVVRETIRPSEVLLGMNDRLLGLTEERFVTAFFGLFDRHTRTMTCACAGQPPPVLYSAKQDECSPIGPSGLMLGVMDDVEYAEHTLALGHGDRLCFYTDGVIETANPAGELFGTPRLANHVRDHANLSATDLLSQLTLSLNDYREHQPPADDVTMLVAAVG